MRDSSREAVVAVLELSAAERPELLHFQLHVLLNSSMRLAVLELARIFAEPVEKVGETLYRASLDLDRLEAWRRVWRDPAQFLDSPNVAALYHLCGARVGRVRSLVRRRKLEEILRKLEQAYELAKSRAWTEEFIGPSLADVRRLEGADRRGAALPAPSRGFDSDRRLEA